jgi:hypothetical protein
VPTKTYGVAEMKLHPMFAEVEPALAKRLKKRLIDDGKTYRRWLEEAMREYLTTKPKAEKV